jgi:hypothetical protein
MRYNAPSRLLPRYEWNGMLRYQASECPDSTELILVVLSIIFIHVFILILIISNITITALGKEHSKTSDNVQIVTHHNKHLYY